MEHIEFILAELQNQILSSIQSLISEADSNPDLKLALQVKKTSTGITFGKYAINVKTQYGQRIFELREHGKILYPDLALIETAIAIVKLRNKNADCSQVVTMDDKYAGHRLSMQVYKDKMLQDDISATDYAIYYAKVTTLHDSMSLLKSHISKVKT